MNRKMIPLVLMLIAGGVTSIITFITGYSMVQKLLALLIVLVIFYGLGSALRYALDLFDKQNEKASLEAGEVIEKESQTDEESETEKKESE